jgi:hypothetical protein
MPGQWGTRPLSDAVCRLQTALQGRSLGLRSRNRTLQTALVSITSIVPTAQFPEIP